MDIDGQHWIHNNIQILRQPFNISIIWTVISNEFADAQKADFSTRKYQDIHLIPTCKYSDIHFLICSARFVCNFYSETKQARILSFEFFSLFPEHFGKLYHEYSSMSVNVISIKMVSYHPNINNSLSRLKYLLHKPKIHTQ